MVRNNIIVKPALENFQLATEHKNKKMIDAKNLKT